MGSYWGFTEMDGYDEKVPFYVQFVPGYVVDNVVSSNSHRVNGDRSINSIMAIPHLSERTDNSRRYLDERSRYFPLFRGIVDVPAKGDPVLLCTIGQIKYYLGPLNTDNNPNWNVDNLQQTRVEPDITLAVDEQTQKGESHNFGKIGVNRLQKMYNDELDHPFHPDTGETIKDLFGNPKFRNPKDIHGDMLFEGRHGNSIRIGSRWVNPYVFISNGRTSSDDMENIANGSLLSMTERGTLQQHFGGFTEEVSIDDEDSADFIQREGFTLSSDTILEPSRTMSDLVFISEQTEEDVSEYIYEYFKQQALLHSDRIIINSKKDNIYLSSLKDIHIGSGRNITLSTNEDLIIETRKTFLGKNAITAFREESKEKIEPMVLGQQLLIILTDLIDCLSTANFISPAGAPLPIIDNTQQPIATVDNPGLGRKSLNNIKDQLSKILSRYHYIENNDADK